MLAQPRLVVHVTGGYTLPLPDFKGDIPTDKIPNLDSIYFMKQGLNFGADGKFYVDKRRSIGITLSLAYSLFSNSEDITVLSKTYTVKPKINVFTAGLGVEYAFLPKPKYKVNPFIGVEFTGNFFSGKFEYEPADTSVPARDLKSEARFGLGVGAGIDIKLSKNIGIVVGGKYHLANLIGKDYDSTGITKTEFPLNDKEHTSGARTIEAKNISWIQFYAGISFYLMQPKKIVKK
jgi:outer membrane protein W